MQSNQQVFSGTLLNPCPVSVNMNGVKNYVGSLDDCYRSCYRNLGAQTNVLNTGCALNCQKCGYNLSLANLRRPATLPLVPPPFWIEPNYFRQGFAHYKNVNQAYTYCNEMCKTTRNPGDCQKNCFIDANSIFYPNK
jgi:hypothetical protein